MKKRSFRFGARLARGKRVRPKITGSIPAGDEGPTVVGSILTLLVLGGAVYGATQWFDDSPETKQHDPVSTLLSQWAPSFYGKSQIRQFGKACKATARRSRTARLRCRRHERRLLSQHRRQLRIIRQDRHRYRRLAQGALRHCRRTRDARGGRQHQRWFRESAAWYRDVLRYSKSGGEHPGVYPPTLPEACQRKKRPAGVSSRARRTK